LKIIRRSLPEGASKAEGIVVVIDVLRAFTSAAFMIHLGAEKILLLTDPDEVLRISQEMGAIAAGEVGGRKVQGFDLGNSPSQILSAGKSFFQGRTVALRSTSGVTGAVIASKHSEMIILGSFVTAKALSEFILNLSPMPSIVTLVAMGDGDTVSTPDDEACADYIQHLLTGTSYDHLHAIRRTFQHELTQTYIHGDQEHFPPLDVTYCFQRDVFDFVLVARKEEGRLVARKTVSA
jgi:2-phosphosulfolactate phosphatase